MATAAEETKVAAEETKVAVEETKGEELSEEVAKKVFRQVEFYFGDSNFRGDKFLRGECEKNAEGNIPFSVIASFKRMQQLSTNIPAMVAVLRKSDRVVISEDGTLIRRSKPLPEVDDSKERTVYAKGFPSTATLEELEEYFNTFGRVGAVRMRRKGKAGFKGSVTVEYEALESAQKFLAEESPSFKDTALVEVSTLEAYEAASAALKAQGGQKAGGAATVNPDEVTFEKGIILKLVGVGEGTSREDLTAAVEAYGVPQFVDFSRGATDGFMRFDSADVASKTLAGMTEAGAAITGAVPTWSLLEGEEEKAYHVAVAQRKLDAKKRRREGGGRGRGRGRGNKRQRRD